MLRVFSLVAAISLSLACASGPPSQAGAAAGVREAAATPRGGERISGTPGAAVVSAAVEMLGAPYRYGGSSPSGFDCSGLVVYSYAKAGYRGLPHSASRLADISEPVDLDALKPGDLLLFELTGKKASHVGIYAGNRQFIHAPSSGGHVEIVDFDHVYWRNHIGKAGRLIDAENVARAH